MTRATWTSPAEQPLVSPYRAPNIPLMVRMSVVSSQNAPASHT
jgi:hypothetical protein